ncbi:ribonuclease H-like domain-containing protein [Tanacetum coccineum]
MSSHNSFSTVSTASISANNAKISYLEKDKYEIWARNEVSGYRMLIIIFGGLFSKGNSPKRLGKDAKGNTIVHPPVSLDELVLNKGNKSENLVAQLYLKIICLFSSYMMQGIFGYKDSEPVESSIGRPDNDDINLKFLRALPSSWSQVALALKTRGGLESMSFDDLYNKLSYGVKAAAAPTHSAFIGAASLAQSLLILISRILFHQLTEGRLDAQILIGYFARECNVKTVDDKASFAMTGISPKVQNCPLGCDSKINDLNNMYNNLDRLYNDCYIKVQAYQNAVKTLESQKDWYNKTQIALEEKIRILSANLENTTNTLCYTEKLYDQAQKEKKEWEVKFEATLARFEKWKESSKNLKKLINSSMSTRTKIGLGFKEYFGKDEVFDLSTPSVFYPEPVEEDKPLYSWFVKAGEMHAVPPSITGTYMPTPYKSDIEGNTGKLTGPNDKSLQTQRPKHPDDPEPHDPDQRLPPTVDIQDFADLMFRKTKFHASSPYPFVNLKQLLFQLVVEFASISFLLVGSDPAASRNSADRPNPAGWSKRPATVSAGRPVSAGRWYTAVNDLSRLKSELAWVSQRELMEPRKNLMNLSRSREALSNLEWRMVEYRKGAIRPSKLDFEMSTMFEDQQHVNCSLSHKSDEKRNKVLSQTLIVWWLSKKYQLPDERIKRDYSNPNPTKNGVAERKNRTLIEAARTMLADSKLPTMFWTEAVSSGLLCTQETNVDAGTQDHDSYSEVDEHVIVVPSFPSNSFAGPRQACTSAGSDPAGSHPAGSFDPAALDDPAVSTSVSADFIPVHADESTLPPEDDFRCYSYKLSPAVEVNPVPTKRVNTIHPQSQILGDLASPVLTRSRAHKSKFGESAFIGYIQDQQRTNQTDQLHLSVSACFLSQLDQLVYLTHFEDPDWVDANARREQHINQPRQVWNLSLYLMAVHAIETNGFEKQEVWPEESFWFKALCYGRDGLLLGLQVKQLPDVFLSPRQISTFSWKRYSDSDYAGSHEQEADYCGNIFYKNRYVAAATAAPQVVNTAARCTFFLLTDLVSAGRTKIQLLSFSGRLVSAGRTMVLLVVILSAGRLVSAGRTMVLLLWIYAADSYTMLWAILLLFFYAANTSIHAAGLVCAGSIMFLLADLFLLVVTCFCCAQLDIADLLLLIDFLPAGLKKEVEYLIRVKSLLYGFGGHHLQLKQWRTVDFHSILHLPRVKMYHNPIKRYALTHDPPVVFDSLVKQFWATATVRPNAAGSHDLVATIDGREGGEEIPLTHPCLPLLLSAKMLLMRTKLLAEIGSLQNFSLVEPLVFGPEPRPAGYVDPDVLEPIIFGPQPRPSDFVDPDLRNPLSCGPPPRLTTILSPRPLIITYSMEDDTIHGGFHEESHVGPDDAPTPTTDAAGRAEDPTLLTSLSAKLDRFSCSLSADVLPQAAISESAGPSVGADKGKAPMPDLDIPAEFLAEDAQARKRLEEEQASAAASLNTLIDEYEYICRCLEKDRLLSAQYNLFRPKPVITEPPSKRQRVDSDTSQPSGVPAASTQHADDPDSAGGEAFQLLQWILLVTRGINEFFLDSDEDEQIGMSRVAADPDSDDEVLAEIIFRGQSISGHGVVVVDKLPDDEIVDPRVKVETIPDSAASPPRSRRKHRGVKSDDSLWDKPVEDFFSSESESDDDMENYIPPLPIWCITRLGRCSTLCLFVSHHSDDVEIFGALQDDRMWSSWKLDIPRASVHVYGLNEWANCLIFCGQGLSNTGLHCLNFKLAYENPMSVLHLFLFLALHDKWFISSPWLTAKKESQAHHLQTALVCISNPLILLWLPAWLPVSADYVSADSIKVVPADSLVCIPADNIPAVSSSSILC